VTSDFPYLLAENLYSATRILLLVHSMGEIIYWKSDRT